MALSNLTMLEEKTRLTISVNRVMADYCIVLTDEDIS